MNPRKILFWFHLVAGVVAGVIILVMSLTGAAIAFEKEILGTMDSHPREASPKEGQSRTPLASLLSKARELQPDARPSALIIQADIKAPITISMGRTNAFYASPITGELRPQGAAGWRAFFQTMNRWHRWLGREGDGRAVGKAITGACNAAFLVLTITGLFLWWPRNWTAKAVAGVSIPKFNLGGKARDFNWHNAVGLWSAPVLIILTATGMVLSYRWAGDLVYKVAGSDVPARDGGGPGNAAPAIEIPRPVEGTKRLSHEALLQRVQTEEPQWETATIRLGGGENRVEQSKPRAEGNRDGEHNGPQPVVISIREKRAWPLFASRQLTFNPFTGELLKSESFSDYNTGRKARAWMRFLHTGEAFGVVGKAIATLASLGGALLVWTGLALAWRRFLGWKRKSPINPEAA